MNLADLTRYANGIRDAINYLFVPVVISIAFITFLWGVYKYFILDADSDTERETGRQFVIWGVVGFVVIVSIWGLVNLVGGTLGFVPGGANNVAPPPPKI